MPIPAEAPAYRDLSDWIVVTILDAIKSGTITPGERLIEREVAKQLKVSRAPVRDALYKLQMLGVVEHREPRGAYVKSWTVQDIAELVLLLDAVILLSVQLSIELIDESTISELEQILKETRAGIERASNDVAEQATLDHRFHVVIARASRRERVVQMIQNLSLPLQLCQPEFLTSLGGRAYSLRTHEELLSALKGRDLDEAIACTMRHARDAQRVILGLLYEPARTAEAPDRVSEPTAIRIPEPFLQPLGVDPRPMVR